MIAVPHQAEKIGLMTVRASVQGVTFSMRGHLYRGHANATALSSSPVVSAQGSESDDPGSSPGLGKAWCPLRNASSATEAWLNLYIIISVTQSLQFNFVCREFGC